MAGLCLVLLLVLGLLFNTITITTTRTGCWLGGTWRRGGVRWRSRRGKGGWWSRCVEDEVTCKQQF